MNLRNDIKKILREEVERKYLKPSQSLEKLVYNVLNKLFLGANMYHIKHYESRHDFEFCKNGKKLMNFILFFNHNEDVWDDNRKNEERNLEEGIILMYKDTINDILKLIPIRRNYLKHVIDEWIEETYLDKISKEMGRNDITVSSFDELDGSPDPCVPPPTKPEGISDEEMIDFIIKNTLYSRKDIEKNESKEPGWIEDMYLKKLRDIETNRLSGNNS
jgi:hypothetical protein